MRLSIMRTVINLAPRSAILRAMRCIAGVSLLGAIGACAPSEVLTGTVRPSILESEVVVYSAAPPKFEQIAVLSASSKTAFAVGGEKSFDKVVQRLKARAAKLGANGLILGDFSDEQSLSLGTGLGSDSYTHNGSISLGMGGFFGVYKKTGEGRAIYVPPRE
jgi:hypothetical protein